MVLYSGNHEIIGVRHRASQTLYVSELIKPYESDPAYGTIEVGIYVAAIQETMDRIDQGDTVALVPTPYRRQEEDQGEEDGNENDEGEDGHANKRARKSESSGGPENGGSTRAYTSQGKKMSASGNVDQVCH
jgi:hypothetical protein